jgi:hydrogenase maturation protein HypF
VGRLFDAVSALCGIRATVNYEGQAAAELEGVAALDERGSYHLGLIEGDGSAPLVLDPRPTIRALVDDLAAGTEPPIAAARFHNALAVATAEACAAIADRLGIAVAVLSGGVFQNRLLLERTAAALGARGLRVLVPERLPPNDGGVSYGQAAIAAARG